MYGKHVVTEEEDLDPILRAPITTRSWFNLSQAATWLILGGLLLGGYAYGEYLIRFNPIEKYLDRFITLNWILEYSIGLLLTQTLLILGYALELLLIFRFADRNRSSLIGEVRMSSDIVNHKRLYHFIPFSIILLAVYAYNPSAFTLGCAIAPFISMLSMWQRIRRARKTAS